MLLYLYLNLNELGFYTSHLEEQGTEELLVISTNY